MGARDGAEPEDWENEERCDRGDRSEGGNGVDAAESSRLPADIGPAPMGSRTVASPSPPSARGGLDFGTIIVDSVLSTFSAAGVRSVSEPSSPT